MGAVGEGHGADLGAVNALITPIPEKEDTDMDIVKASSNWARAEMLSSAVSILVDTNASARLEACTEQLARALTPG